jgi:lipocalin
LAREINDRLGGALGRARLSEPAYTYARIMARSETIPEKRYQELVAVFADSGHDVAKLRRVPRRRA